ncbi:Cfr10I/Bse634I family restriction endonuclease [Streptomyces sp. BK239]|uniref:Cfr10I/Bse634I family restriction endonuclease n=1 Tax=Streptomyces sp. BK239 TaxID=2512155 RepID=UPI0010F35373|nr:Cfr10I/Bse634I family restriction endonuclease [Streptomyces sp. BK239]RZU21753.1 Cfr10I/Bse634I restriction endonuclease [Streptomyces sp. BK239]
MPFAFSQVETKALKEEDRCITDLRDAPIRNRTTKFRLAQQNMLAYTFPSFIPGFAAAGINNMPYAEIISRPLENAKDEGKLLYDVDFSVSSSAEAKVAGDIFEIVSSAVMWNAAAWWNRYMIGGAWGVTPRYAKPKTQPSPSRQVAVLNLPRDYDWVQLLVPEARDKISEIRNGLGDKSLGLPTSTPDLAVVVVPEELRGLDLWSTPLPNLNHPAQSELREAHKLVQGRIEPGEIILAVAFKKSLRSDRLYQPLYEANVMQLLLEGRLGAPRVEFEVHTLAPEGTDAFNTYTAASLYAVAEDRPDIHRAVRELYIPATASDMVQRLFGFLNERMALVTP